MLWLALSHVFVASARTEKQPVSTGTIQQGQPGIRQEKDIALIRRLLNSAVFITVPWSDPHYEDMGLGTVIGEDSILTAKHVGTYRVVTQTDLPALMIDSASVTGAITVTFSYHASQGVKSGADLMRIDLPPSNGITLPAPASLASPKTIQSIRPGTWLSVVYYDDQANQLHLGDFKLIGIDSGIAKLDDPGRIIQPGDSGGGVYYNDQLVGVTSAIVLNSVRTYFDGKLASEQTVDPGQFLVTLNQ